MGSIYALVARAMGPLLRRCSGISPRAVLAVTLVVWGLAALLPLGFPHHEAALWAGALTGALASGVVWPIVESYLGAGRRGAELRTAIGVGYLVGPLLGLAGHGLGGPGGGATTTAALTSGAAALTAFFAVRPYLAARRRR